jgi:hypothetical protein
MINKTNELENKDENEVKNSLQAYIDTLTSEQKVAFDNLQKYAEELHQKMEAEMTPERKMRLQQLREERNRIIAEMNILAKNMK